MTQTVSHWALNSTHSLTHSLTYKQYNGFIRYITVYLTAVTVKYLIARSFMTHVSLCVLRTHYI